VPKKIKLSDIIADIRSAVSPVEMGSRIPDIITFCNDKRYLGFKDRPSPISLKPVQKIILKCFYRKSVGNEDLELTDEEIDLCKKLGLNDPDRGNVLRKYESGDIFRELVLVWGRRSGKDFLSAIIALYEAMKLLEVPGGDPHAYYNVAAADINILTIANSKGQAGIAFTEIREKLLDSEYFKDKFVKEGISALSIRLLTPKDRLENRDFVESNLGIKTTGSVNIEVGHSNSHTLLGKSCFVLILDEVASYKNTGGSASGDRIYSALTPSIISYYRKEPVFDEDGEAVLDEYGLQLEDTIFDGKIISISSPRGKEGKLWDMFSQSDLHNETLACRLPTWHVFPDRSRESLKKTYPTMSEQDFEMEFGAEFAGTVGHNFFSEDHVNLCFKKNIKSVTAGQAGYIYFLHLDPASTSHNYALAMVHKQIFLNPETKKADFYIIVDMVKYWHPTPNRPIDGYEVDKFVINLKRFFRVGMVTFDSWNSSESRMRLLKSGMPHKETRFSNRYKMIIYSEIEQLVNAGKLIIPADSPASELLRQEMLNLLRKPIPTGYRIGPRKDGDGVHTDDLIDAVAGACYMAMNKSASSLPQGRLVDTGSVSNSKETLWQSMSGPLGYGTGQQVANALDQRQPWKMSK